MLIDSEKTLFQYLLAHHKSRSACAGILGLRSI